MKTIFTRGVLALSGLMAAALCMAQQITVTLNGQAMQFPAAQPQVINGRVLVPMRGIFEALGAQVHWLAATETVNANKGNVTVQLQIGNQAAVVNGRTVNLDVPPQLVSDSTMVPLRFVSEALGADVNWISAQNTVAITVHAPDEHYVRPDRPKEVRHGTPPPTIRVFPAGAVFPLRLDGPLSSNRSQTGDSFSCTLYTYGAPNYGGLPAGTQILGHVEYAHNRTATEPGFLKLAFDSVQLPNGALVPIDGDLIGLDANSVVRGANGLLKTNPRVIYGPEQAPVWVGSKGGVKVTLVPRKHLTIDVQIRQDLGHWFQRRRTTEIVTSDVMLGAGTELGVRLERAFALP